MKFTGSSSIAVHQAEGVTLVSPSKELNAILNKKTTRGSVLISSDFTPSIDGSSVRIGSGTVIETYTAFVNGGGEVPAISLSSTQTQPVTFPTGPTSGYIYLEIQMAAPDGPDSPSAPGSAESFEMDVDGNAYLVSAYCGSSPGRISGSANLTAPFVFYQEKQAASSSYFRKLLASVTLNGSGTPTSVQQLHFGDIFIPQPTNIRFGLTIDNL